MPLKTDSQSIQSSLGFKHYKDFCTAINAQGSVQVDRVREFREQFNSHGLPDKEEKDWLLNVTTTITHTKKNVRDSVDWSVTLRKELKEVAHVRLREFITRLGAGAIGWIRVFGASANLVDLQKIVVILGPENAAWVELAPPDQRTVDRVGKCLAALTSAQLSNQEIRKLWDQFNGVDRSVVWEMMQATPVSCCRAYRHLLKLDAPDKFWMRVKDSAEKKETIRRVSAIAYQDMTWNDKPTELNEAAGVLINSIDKPWVKLFTIARLIELRAKLKLNPLLGKSFLAKAGDLASIHSQGAEDAAFGDWLSLHCELVMELIHNGYTDLAIVAMFKNNFKKREIITCTWFRRQKLTFSQDDDLLFRVTGLNGGVIGRRSHLAARHLYRHFDFTDIKDENSFHPPDTTVTNMVALSGNIILPDRTAGKKYIKNYVVVVGQENVKEGVKPNLEKNLVISLYPVLPSDHRDHYTSKELAAIKNVLEWVPSGNRELAWR